MKGKDRECMNAEGGCTRYGYQAVGQGCSNAGALSRARTWWRGGWRLPGLTEGVDVFTARAVSVDCREDKRQQPG